MAPMLKEFVESSSSRVVGKALVEKQVPEVTPAVTDSEDPETLQVSTSSQVGEPSQRSTSGLPRVNEQVS